MARKNGFTLIEMLVAVGILGIICASAASLFTSFSAQNKAIQSSLESNELRNDLGRILSDPSLCNNAIENKPFSTREGSVTNLQIFSAQFGSRTSSTVSSPSSGGNDGISQGGNPTSGTNPSTPQGLTAGAAYKNLSVQSFDLRRVRLEKNNPTGADVYSGEASLVFAKRGSLLGSKSSKEYALRVFFESSNGTTIDPGGCLGVFQGNTSQACQIVGGRWIAESETCDLCTVRGGNFNASKQTCDTCTYVQGVAMPDQNSNCNICPGLGQGWARDPGRGICQYNSIVPLPSAPVAAPPPTSVTGGCYCQSAGSDGACAAAIPYFFSAIDDAQCNDPTLNPGAFMGGNCGCSPWQPAP